MSKTVTLGGDRLGSGKKQKVELHGFERSTHDLGYVWRNTQAPGTLVPFMTMLALPGDSFDINLGADVKTHPTLGPLFASFKLQLDVFECPIRLYHGWLHNNKLKIGNDMSKVKLPQLELDGNPLNIDIWDENGILLSDATPLELQQINPSSLLSYLGTRGIGQGTHGTIKRNVNAIPYLSYWDIYKNYYANKQEEIGMYINSIEPVYVFDELTITKGASTKYTGKAYDINYQVIELGNYAFTVNYYGETEPTKMELYLSTTQKPNNIFRIENDWLTKTPITGGWTLEGEYYFDDSNIIWGLDTDNDNSFDELTKNLKIDQFDLEAIDTMRENILHHSTSEPFMINSDSIAPYGSSLGKIKSGWSTGQMSSVFSQQGLALKTYQSDLFNNWLNSEWIDGEGGINEITRVTVTDGSFDIESLGLARKVYNMLNRIAVSGGSYDDWLEAVYDHQGFGKAESPMYHGGLSKEIIFQEVVSNSATESEPLGSLAGKGHMSSKHKGGQVNIKVNEPSFIIGIVSITPRIDYYQGNEFFINHTTMNDLHKPSLDEIGFQDAILDKFASWSTVVNDGILTFVSAGKQPAWLDYMTNYNRLYGNFADERNEMFMTLARRYEMSTPEMIIKDLTTYIDPTKFNYAFAQTDITAQNFWVQIGVDCTARRKMSAKIMPNL